MVASVADFASRDRSVVWNESHRLSHRLQQRKSLADTCHYCFVPAPAICRHPVASEMVVWRREQFPPLLLGEHHARVYGSHSSHSSGSRASHNKLYSLLIIKASRNHR